MEEKSSKADKQRVSHFGYTITHCDKVSDRILFASIFLSQQPRTINHSAGLFAETCWSL